MGQVKMASGKTVPVKWKSSYYQQITENIRWISNFLHFIWNLMEQTVCSFQIDYHTKAVYWHSQCVFHEIPYGTQKSYNLLHMCKTQLQQTWYIPVPHFPARYPGCHMPFAGQTHWTRISLTSQEENSGGAPGGWRGARPAGSTVLHVHEAPGRERETAKS